MQKRAEQIRLKYEQEKQNRIQAEEDEIQRREYLMKQRLEKRTEEFERLKNLE